MKLPSEASKLVEYEFRDCGSMTASEFIANKHDIPVTNDDISCIIDEHPGISATEASDFVVFLNCADSYGSWMQRGIARRIRLGDPAELATFISVGSRFEVLRGCDPVDQYVQVFEILRAYATRDIDCVNAWIKRSPYTPEVQLPDSASPSVKSLMTLQPPDYFNRLDIVD